MKRRLLQLLAIATWALTASPWVQEPAHESFAIHMLQHVSFVMIVAPLVAFATPAWLHPRARWSTSAVSVVLLHTIALWAWHLPVLYDAALHNAALHLVEHLSFVGTAWLFWLLVIREGDHLARAAAVFAVGLQSAALGALLTFASEPLYGHAGVARWDLTALEDQQLAGGIMWVPPGIVYLAVTLLLVGIGLRRSNHPVIET